MRSKLSEQEHATIYQYKLTKRIVISRELIQSHFLTLAIFTGFLLWIYNIGGLFGWLAGFTIVQLLHLFVLLITFIRVEEATDRKWIWRINPPWVGFKPANDINLLLFRRVHRHLFWIGLLIIAMMYPWVPAALTISMFFWHIWLIVPRLLLAFFFRKQPKNGVIRLQSFEASYYSR
ncbi:transposase [Paenibacillus yanchengensis]|uniref:Transposase n=1 Tax=Paenibacillus yanchengensis TaxID=2035833 RepID=A0ABW4YJ23_9BACL